MVKVFLQWFCCNTELWDDYSAFEGGIFSFARGTTSRPEQTTFGRDKTGTGQGASDRRDATTLGQIHSGRRWTPNPGIYLHFTRTESCVNGARTDFPVFMTWRFPGGCCWIVGSM
ncbi:hypothetical protein NQD34_009175 [Periophthalmus magnuspinnatus]|nr:hypothetical protein NQD34_009175 [Periophthalmus magnuspinnatus]